jgi:Protein of unknown function (DUF3800)
VLTPAAEPAAPRNLKDADPPFVWILDVILPRGGYVTVEVAAYFDESGSHEGSPILCVAGYIIEKLRAVELTRQWNEVLRKYELPFFRMSDCAHGNGPFGGMTKQQRLQIEMLMVGIIKKWTVQGIAVTVNSDEFEKLMPKHPLIGSPYSFSAHTLLGGVYEWISQQRMSPIDKMAYFFEAGHQSQGEANAIMNKLFEIEKFRKDYRYAGHSFVPKDSTPAVQAADLLAWQWYTDKRHQLEARPRRKDCTVLLEHPHNAVHIDQGKIVAMNESWLAEQPENEQLLRLHYGDKTRPKKRR